MKSGDCARFLDGFYVELMKKMLPHHPKVMELGTESEGKSIFGGTINLGFVKVDGKSFCRYTIEMGKEVYIVLVG